MWHLSLSSAGINTGASCENNNLAFIIQTAKDNIMPCTLESQRPPLFHSLFPAPITFCICILLIIYSAARAASNMLA